VAFHVREPGYSPSDELVHAHRNGSLQAVAPALQEIVRRGGWCIRLGDPTGSPMPQLFQVIDYARLPVRSERMDVFLCAKARFLLGNSSGISFVSSAFGVPVAFANMIPTSALGMLPCDISIPKVLHMRGSSREMRFNEVLGGPSGNFRLAKLFEESGIEIAENSPDDILDLVREMLDRLEGTFSETEEDRVLQDRFKSLLRPGHYGFGAVSRVGSAFLRKYRHLLPA
jgi:putative glycosyltransferase (TIGR04372 family)